MVCASMVSASSRKALTNASSLMEVRLIRTFNKAPRIAVRAHIIDTQASVTALLLPF